MAPKKAVTKTSSAKVDELIGGDLNPQEEKVLNWILNGIIIFVLSWLALGIAMSVGGLYGLWK